MKKIAVGVILVVAIVVAAYFVGVIPGLNILGDEGYETQSIWYGCYQGNPNSELLLPQNRKGYIVSYRDDLVSGLSENMMVAGDYKAQAGWQYLDKYKYVLKYKSTPTSNWDVISDVGNGNTVDWVVWDTPNGENPGKLAPYHGLPGDRNCKAYAFNLRGLHEGAIRAELWGYFDPNNVNPFDTWVWKMMSSDQALLFSGECGMWLPKRPDGGYQSTFEIGEDVKIKVETGVGAPDIDVDARSGEKTWELHLLKPDGNEYTGQNFPRQLTDHFQGDVVFTVSSDMWQLGETNRWMLKLYNVMWSKGSLEISTIDFRAKRPSAPTMLPDCGLSVEVPDTVSVEISAISNPDTQVPINSFGVKVWYGQYSDLDPGAWGDERWILRQTSVPASKSGEGYAGQFTFDVANADRYVTIIAFTHDDDGRDSDTEYYQIRTYAADAPRPDDEELEDEGGGQGSYGGGTSGETTPWGDYSYNDEITGTTALVIGAIIAAVIFAISCILAVFLPLPGGIYGKILVVISGALLAILVFFLFGGVI